MVSRRLMVRHRVDLPEPDGPSTTTTWPRGISRLMFFRAWKSSKYFSTPSIAIMAVPPPMRESVMTMKLLRSLPGAEAAKLIFRFRSVKQSGIFPRRDARIGPAVARRASSSEKPGPVRAAQLGNPPPVAIPFPA